MPRVSRQSIEQVKARADIVDVVSEVVKLQQRGQNFFGLCPFHEEKTPSFSVSPAKGIYHCFGCGKGGDSLSFIMEYEKLDYFEAIKYLARKYGLQLEFVGGGEEDKGQQTLIPLLYELHDLAADYFHKTLFSPKGKGAVDYLKKRHFDEADLKQFKVGFATDDWDGFLKTLDRKKFPPPVLAKSGLVIARKEGGGFFDRFRNRIMFPIKNLSGRTIAFGGRTLDPNEKAKYMNSPETPVYNKSAVLYGFDLSKNDIVKGGEAIVVEGYTDLMRFYKSGVPNVVAGSGTALTEKHVQQLKRFCNKVTLCYDGDSAGQKAAERAGFLFIKQGFDVRIVQLPAKDDPDSFMQTQGLEAFQKKESEALDYINFYIEQQKNVLKGTGGQRAFVETLSQKLVEIDDAITRDIILKTMSDRVNISEQVIRNRLSQLYRQNLRRSSAARPKEEALRIDIPTAEDKAEYELTRLLLLQNDDLAEAIINLVTKENFTHPVLQFLYQKIHQKIMNDSGWQPGDLYDDDFQETHRFYLSRMIMELDQLAEENDNESLHKLTIDCLTQVRGHGLDKEINDARNRIRELDKNGEDSIEQVIKLADLQQKRKNVYREIQEMLTEL